MHPGSTNPDLMTFACLLYQFDSVFDYLSACKGEIAQM